MRTLGALLLALAALQAASEPPATPASLQAEALKAYEAGDHARFLELERRALELAPTNPRLLYNVACGEALLGHSAAAVRLLDELLARKLDLGAETDADFSKIHGSPEWMAFVSRLAELREPLVRSEVAFRLADPDLLATGIAVDPGTGDTFVASVRKRKIVRRTREGALSDFTREAQDGFLAGASLAVDPARRLLFASASAAPHMIGYRPEDSGRSGVFAFDVASAKLVRKALLPADGKRHFLNALALDGHGTVYVSDSGVSGIYRLRPGAGELEVFVPGGVFDATQGISLSEDEKTLYVADYSDGLWALDIATRERRRLAEPPGTWLGGLDGLSRVPGGFIAVQIGVQPPRVLRLRLDPRGDRVAAVDLLEMGHPDYSGPIQGAVAGGAFLYVANSQLDLVDPRTGAFAADRARPTVILRLPL